MNRGAIAFAIFVGMLAILVVVWSKHRPEGGSYFVLECFSKSRESRSANPTDQRSWGVIMAEASTRSVPPPPGPVEDEEQAVRPLDNAPAVEVSAPLVVYRDAGDPENSFVPSGWMGDLKSIELDTASATHPHSGTTCVRISYRPAGLGAKGWSGIYFQHPADNWGALPGYRVSHAAKLTFWARGEEGDERAEFKVGGINRRPYHDPALPHEDSSGPLSTGVVTLSREWRRFCISLESVDAPIHLIGGFCWVTARWQNPEGCTIYLDDIVIERVEANRQLKKPRHE